VVKDSMSSEVTRPAQTLGGASRLCWADIALSALVTLVLAVPTMAVEEDWHGRPMIDQSSHLWMVAAAIVVTGFLAGGFFAGYRRPAAAVANAAAAAGIAVIVLIMAALSRRFLVVHEGVPSAVVELWCWGLVAGIVSSAVSSQLGQRFARSRG
jgi:hypothetical protein